MHSKIFLPALCFCLINTVAHAASISGQGTWESTLQGRDLDGNLSTFEAYYDTALNITWLADANYGAGSAYDDIGSGPFGGTTTDGRMTWGNANAWAASLNPYGSGIAGWRLPTMTDTGAAGCDFAYSGTDCGFNVNTATSEMAHMFYNTLGNSGYYTTSGSFQGPPALTNTGLFSNMQTEAGYWSNLGYAPNLSEAWLFAFFSGDQTTHIKSYAQFAWAVHDGDVGIATPSAVPVPAAAWLFGSGLLGLIGIARKKRV